MNSVILLLAIWVDSKEHTAQVHKVVREDFHHRFSMRIGGNLFITAKAMEAHRGLLRSH